MACQDCGHTWTGPGYDGDIISDSCPNCGSYRLQPSPTHSDMEMRNMSAPGENDMGGNPLQEGVWAQTDGGWANRMKRDESFASVKTADYDDDDWGDDDDEGANPYQGYSDEDAGQHGVQERFIITPEGKLHRPSAALLEAKGPERVFHEDVANENGLGQSFLKGHSLGQVNNDGTINFVQHATPHSTDMLRQIVAPHYPEHQIVGDVAQQSNDQRWNVDNSPEGRAQRVNPAYQDKMNQTQQAEQQRGGRPFSPYENPYMNRGGSMRDHLYLPWSHDASSIAGDLEMESALDPRAMDDQIPTPEQLAAMPPEQAHAWTVAMAMRQNNISLQNAGQRGQQFPPDTGAPNPALASVKVSFLPLLLGLAGGALGAGAAETAGGAIAGRIGGNLVGHMVGNAISGNPNGGGNAAPVAEPALNGPGGGGQSWDTLSSVHARFVEGDYEHPSSNPGFDDTDDPESVDQHEVNDGSHDDWQKDQDVDGTGGADSGIELDSDVGRAFVDALPSLLKYYDSPESGQEDPTVAHLAELLEAQMPGLIHGGAQPTPEEMGHLQDALAKHKGEGAAHEPSAVGVGGHLGASPMAPMGPGMAAPGMQQLQAPMQAPQQQVAPQTQASCPHCGARLNPGAGVCPQCNGAVSADPQANANAGTAMNAPAQTSPTPSPVQNMPVMAANQGPINSQQQQMVLQYLKQQGTYRPEMAEDIIMQPQNYADVLAEIQGKQQQPPEADPDAGPPMAPPPGGDPSAMGAPPPGMSGPPQGMPVQAAADSVAPPCPKCGSHTTGVVSKDGMCHCTHCDNTWSEKMEIQGDDSSHVAGASPWETQDGEPLVEGQAYQMHSSKFSVPETVVITKVRGGHIEYTLTGAYNLQHRTAVTAQEANDDGLFFTAADAPTNDPTQTEPEYQYNEAGPSDQTDLSSPSFSQYAKTAGKKFTPREQREFIDEPGRARNAEKLDLEGTHYVSRDEAYSEAGHGLSEDFYLFGL